MHPAARQRPAADTTAGGTESAEEHADCSGQPANSYSNEQLVLGSDVAGYTRLVPRVRVLFTRFAVLSLQ